MPGKEVYHNRIRLEQKLALLDIALSVMKTRQQRGRIQSGETLLARGADGGQVFEKSLDCIANEGRIVIFGYASGKWFDAPS